MSDQIGIPSGQTLFQVGKYTRVTTKGAAIRDAVFPIPFPGPNVVLFQVLGALTTAAKEVAGIGNILAGDAAIANAPPTTVLALIEQGMKFYTAIAKRVFRAMKAEAAKLYALNRKHIDKAQEYRIGDEGRVIEPDDYRQGGGVEPVADPTMTTDMQKLGRAQILMSTITEPEVDRKEILTRFYEAANIDRVGELFAPPDSQAIQDQQVVKQFAMAKAQAELGELRAKELKDQTQAFLNMALARKNADASSEAWIEAQLNYMRLNIEALNTANKAAEIDHRYHDTAARERMDSARHIAAAGQQARDHAHNIELAHTNAALSPQPQPGPTGPFPVPPSAPVGPDVVSPSSIGTGTPAVPDVEGAGPSGPPAQSVPDMGVQQ